MARWMAHLLVPLPSASPAVAPCPGSSASCFLTLCLHTQPRSARSAAYSSPTKTIRSYARSALQPMIGVVYEPGASGGNLSCCCTRVDSHHGRLIDRPCYNAGANGDLGSDEDGDDAGMSFKAWLRRNPLPTGRGTSATASPAALLNPDVFGNSNAHGGVSGAASNDVRHQHQHQRRAGAIGADIGAGCKDGGGGCDGLGRRGGSCGSNQNSVSCCREFQVSELVGILEPLLSYPRVDWDARRLVWVSYLCCPSGAVAGGSTSGGGGGAGGGGSSSARRAGSVDIGFGAPESPTIGSIAGTAPTAAPGLAAAAVAAAAPAADLVSEWIPAVRVELPRLAPRPRGCSFGDKAARLKAAAGRGGEGWETGPDAWAYGGSSSSSGGGSSSSRDLLLSYLDELRAAAARCRRRPAQGQKGLQFPYGLCNNTTGKAVEAGDAGGGGQWDDLEVAAGEEELRLLSVKCGQEDDDDVEEEASVSAVVGLRARSEEEANAATILLETEWNEETAAEARGRMLVASDTVAGARGVATVNADGVANAAAAVAASTAASGSGFAAAETAAATAATAATVVRHPVRPVDAALVLLSADSAALGVWLDGRLVRHKVLTGYTVRHSAGGSQARRDRCSGGDGGGRSVGAALRRTEATRLWQAAAARLAEWAPELAACRVLMRSGDSRVFSQLYAARRPPPPVDLRDPRWEGVGVSVPRPRLRDLLAVHRQLSTGRIEFLGAEE